MQAAKRVYWYSHEPLKFTFKSSKESFLVDEQAAAPFTGKGNYLILHIKKQNLSTWDMIDLLAEQCNIPKQNIGYAGLKDKYATTTQYISIPKRFKRDLKLLKDKRITILETFLHSEAIRIGDLSTNFFTITLEGVTPIMAGKMEKLFRKMQKDGIPNYFGYQRFGSSLDSIDEGKAIIEEDKQIQDKRLKKFFINAYSSHLFNAWLAKRVGLKASPSSSHPFKLLEGDVFIDTKTDKLFIPSKLSSVEKSFVTHDVVPTGLIAGRNIMRATKKAAEFESDFDDIAFYNQGHRRKAIVFPTQSTFKYHHDTQTVSLKFALPKGSYATILLEALGNQELS
jgi:tRNA pseudouridine13 synthase